MAPLYGFQYRADQADPWTDDLRWTELRGDRDAEAQNHRDAGFKVRTYTVQVDGESGA